jgi:biopolymer transport protein ExbB
MVHSIRMRKFASAAALIACVVFGAALPVVSQAQQAPATAEKAEPPAAAPAAAPPAATGAVDTPMSKEEILENPYGLEAMLRTGDWVSKATLAILLIMSIGTWYILFTKLYEQARLFSQARAANRTFWNAGSVKQGVDSLKKGSAFHFIANSGVEATQHHGGLLESVDLNTWISMSVQRAVETVQNRLQDGLAFLATVGSTAPFVGLFGTVWGIYHALTAIGIAGQASIDKVAGPVGEALIMTALGLAVAVPAVLGYNWLIRRNKRAMEQVRSFSSDLHSVLLGAGAKAKAA